MGYEARLRQSVSFGKILYRSGKMPDNLDRAVTLLPVVPRDVLVKTALCISDTYETSWIAECMKQAAGCIASNGPGKIFRKRKTCIPETYHGVLQTGAGIWSGDMQHRGAFGQSPL